MNWQSAIKVCDGRIVELEVQAAEVANALREEIDELKAQGERVCPLAHTRSYGVLGTVHA